MNEIIYEKAKDMSIYTDFGENDLAYCYVGGQLDGEQFDRQIVEAFASGYTPNNAVKRAAGLLCARKELDWQPKVFGYLGPMWDGIRCVMKDGSVKYDFQVKDETQVVRKYGVLRYETEEVYRAMSI